MESFTLRLVRGEGAPLPQPRKWLSDPFHLLVTQTNLRGVPYTIAFQPGADGAPRRSQFVSHADHVLFALPLAGASAQGARPDAHVVPPRFSDFSERWQELALHARASGAFPFGFPSAVAGWLGSALPGIAFSMALRSASKSANTLDE